MKCLPSLRRTKEQTEMDTTLEEIDNRVTEAEQISDLKDRKMENTGTEENIEKKKKRKEKKKKK